MAEIDFTQILLQNGISSLFVVVIIAYLYFNSKKKAETLVIRDEDRKDDTDEVAKDLSKTNNQQDVCLAELKKDMEFIRLQVSNHLPTAIKDVSDKLALHDQDERKIWKLLIALAIKNGIDTTNF
jgi:hypothetical protein